MINDEVRVSICLRGEGGGGGGGGGGGSAKCTVVIGYFQRQYHLNFNAKPCKTATQK